MKREISSPKPPLPDGWREVINQLSSVNNGKNQFVHEDGTTVVVRPVALPDFEELKEPISAASEHEKGVKPIGTAYGRTFFSAPKHEKQHDIRLFSAGAPA